MERIGEAILAKVAGSGHRRIARALGLLPDIVRGWLRAFGRSAEAIRAHFTRWAHALDPLLGPIEATGDVFADAVAAIGVATRAAVLALGPRPVWSAVSWMTGGALLCHTRIPFRRFPERAKVTASHPRRRGGGGAGPTSRRGALQVLPRPGYAELRITRRTAVSEADYLSRF